MQATERMTLAQRPVQDRIEAGAEAETSHGLTVRAVILGLLFTCLMDVWIIYSDYSIRSSRFNLTHFPMALLSIFLFLTFVANPILKRVFLRWALSPQEILVILAMGYTGATIANLVNRHWYPFGRLFGRLNPEVNFYVIGFAYFANLDVLFSVWLFGALGFAQAGILNRIGYPIGGEGYDAADWECFGALYVVVLWGLWMSRSHLKQVFWNAFRAGEDRGEELLSYRTAVVGFLLGLAFILGWLYRAGMDLWVLLVFFPTLIVVYLGMTRFVVESGFVFANAPVSEDDFILTALGTENLSSATVTALAFERSLYSYGKALFTPALAHAAKLGDEIGGDRRKLFGAIGLTLAVGLALSIALTLHLGYTTGASNFDDTPMLRGLDGFYRAVSLIRNPEPPKWQQIGFLGVGAGLAVLLFSLRSYFPWWPINPIGLIVGGSYWAHFYLMSVFIAWFCKLVILKVGGAAFYQKFRPFFLGLLVGYALGILTMFFMDVIWFPGSGHMVHQW